jgi:glycoprotein-N-acetylgalactosamine 3-beta-galactosyltransferase
MSDVNDSSLPTIGLGTRLGRGQLTTKTRLAFDYVYNHHFEDADWFLKADDDTYVIVENLLHMLKAHAPSDPIHFGERLVIPVRQELFSGGAGYVLSKEALRRYGQRGPDMCTKDYGQAEDVFMGKCMTDLGVIAGDDRDEHGLARFHCLTPANHLHGQYKQWYYKLAKYTLLQVRQKHHLGIHQCLHALHMCVSEVSECILREHMTAITKIFYIEMSRPLIPLNVPFLFPSVLTNFCH